MLWGNIQMLTILKWVMKQLYMTKLSRGIFVLGNNAVFSASLCIKMEKSLDVLTWLALHNWFVFKRLDWVFMSKTDYLLMQLRCILIPYTTGPYCCTACPPRTVQSMGVLERQGTELVTQISKRYDQRVTSVVPYYVSKSPRGHCSQRMWSIPKQ